MVQLAFLSLGICPREVKWWGKNCTQVFIAAFIAISKHNHPTGEWINNGPLFSN